MEFAQGRKIVRFCERWTPKSGRHTLSSEPHPRHQLRDYEGTFGAYTNPRCAGAVGQALGKHQTKREPRERLEALKGRRKDKKR